MRPAAWSPATAICRSAGCSPARGASPIPFTFVGQFGVSTDGSGLYNMQGAELRPDDGAVRVRRPDRARGGQSNLREYVGNDPSTSSIQVVSRRLGNPSRSLGWHRSNATAITTTWCRCGGKVGGSDIPSYTSATRLCWHGRKPHSTTPISHERSETDATTAGNRLRTALAVRHGLQLLRRLTGSTVQARGSSGGRSVHAHRSQLHGRPKGLWISGFSSRARP